MAFGSLVVYFTQLLIRTVLTVVWCRQHMYAHSRSLPVDACNYNTYQSKPTAKEPSMTGAISLAAVRMLLSAVSLASRSLFRRESSLMASISSRWWGSSSFTRKCTCITSLLSELYTISILLAYLLVYYLAYY